jgi:hypothetical protein
VFFSAVDGKGVPVTGLDDDDPFTARDRPCVVDLGPEEVDRPRWRLLSASQESPLECRGPAWAFRHHAEPQENAP